MKPHWTDIVAISFFGILISTAFGAEEYSLIAVAGMFGIGYLIGRMVPHDGE